MIRTNMKGEKLTKIRLEQTNRNMEHKKKTIKNINRNNNRELNYQKKHIMAEATRLEEQHTVKIMTRLCY